MRFVDLALAALIGTSAITGMVAWSPRPGDAGANGARLQSELRDGLLSLLQQRGTAWLLRPGSGEVCSYLAGASNSSFGLEAVMGGERCGSPPLQGAVVATLSMKLLPYEVVLVAWAVG